MTAQVHSYSCLNRGYPHIRVPSHVLLDQHGGRDPVGFVLHIIYKRLVELTLLVTNNMDGKFLPVCLS